MNKTIEVVKQGFLSNKYLIHDGMSELASIKFQPGFRRSYLSVHSPHGIWRCTVRGAFRREYLLTDEANRSTIGWIQKGRFGVEGVEGELYRRGWGKELILVAAAGTLASLRGGTWRSSMTVEIDPALPPRLALAAVSMLVLLRRFEQYQSQAATTAGVS